ncbi:PIF1-like helicase [Hirsutella rhossiliensis]
MQWRGCLSPSLLQATRTVQGCEACLPPHEGAGVDVCRECRASFDSGRLPKAFSVNNMAIGYTCFRCVNLEWQLPWHGCRGASPSNSLYEDVAINQAEIDGWQYADGSSVPAVIMDRMQREEPSTIGRTQTDHIVPDTDRGLAENSFRSIDELVNSIDPTFDAESCDLDCTLSTEQTQPSPGEPATLVPDSAAIGQEADTVCETSTSGIQAGELRDAEQPPETIPPRQGGRTFLCLEAYAYRGHVLQD